MFGDLLTPGPDNFDEADGRALFIGDFLLINPELVASDPDGVLATLNAAIAAHGGSRSINFRQYFQLPLGLPGGSGG